MSESHFMSLFKRVTGLSFVTYLNHFRIERAQALLAKTEESMAFISQQVGFCDQSYFGIVFRKVVGTTPAIYRRRFRNENPAIPENTQRVRPVLEGTMSVPTSPQQDAKLSAIPRHLIGKA